MYLLFTIYISYLLVKYCIYQLYILFTIYLAYLPVISPNNTYKYYLPAISLSCHFSFLFTRYFSFLSLIFCTHELFLPFTRYLSHIPVIRLIYLLSTSQSLIYQIYLLFTSCLFYFPVISPIYQLYLHFTSYLSFLPGFSSIYQFYILFTSCYRWGFVQPALFSCLLKNLIKKAVIILL